MFCFANWANAGAVVALLSAAVHLPAGVSEASDSRRWEYSSEMILEELELTSVEDIFGITYEWSNGSGSLTKRTRRKRNVELSCGLETFIKLKEDPLQDGQYYWRRQI